MYYHTIVVSLRLAASSSENVGGVVQVTSVNKYWTLVRNLETEPQQQEQLVINDSFIWDCTCSANLIQTFSGPVDVQGL